MTYGSSQKKLRLFTQFYGNPNLLQEMILGCALVSTSQTVCKSTLNNFQEQLYFLHLSISTGRKHCWREDELRYSSRTRILPSSIADFLQIGSSMEATSHTLSSV
jgi:hypothetical protein